MLLFEDWLVVSAWKSCMGPQWLVQRERRGHQGAAMWASLGQVRSIVYHSVPKCYGGALNWLGDVFFVSPVRCYGIVSSP